MEDVHHYFKFIVPHGRQLSLVRLIVIPPSHSHEFVWSLYSCGGYGIIS